jgi:hypothetical protein
MDTRSLYETDTYSWAMEQAAALRRAGASRVSNAVDWENVAEEIESLGEEQRRALVSCSARILEHLLKLEHSPAADPRRRWREEIDRFRVRFARRLADNPGLKPRLGDMAADAWSDARALAVRSLAEDGVPTDAFPEACPYSLDQIRELGWFPARNDTPRA